jgi:hypothetical protein
LEEHHIVKKIAIGVVAGVLLGVSSALHVDVSHADPAFEPLSLESMSVTQWNTQTAWNIAVFCPGVNQSIAQAGSNVANVLTPAGAAVVVNQSNAQTGWNIALDSPGANQTITQLAGNLTTVTSDFTSGVTVNQSNTSTAQNIVAGSPGANQSITQVAGNSVSVSPGFGPPTIANLPVEIRFNVYQSNVQSGWNVCFGQFMK